MTPTGIPDPGYYENTRQELLPLVDPSWMRVLDVGCGAGKLGAALKASAPGRQVHGVEIVEPMAEQARQVLDTVITGDIQTLSLPFSPSTFDCAIFADVLEHLVDPGVVLRNVRDVIRPGGAIVCSIPNIRHYTALQRLILHGWRYDDFGLFDRTHLRFFSLAS